MMRVSRFSTAVIVPLLTLMLARPVTHAEEYPSDQSAPLKLQAILETEIDIEFQRASLREVVTDLATKHGFEVQIDDRELAAHWVTLDVPISVKFTGRTIRSVLESILQLRGLKPRVDNGVVVIDCAERPVDWPRGRLREVFEIAAHVRGVPQGIRFSLTLEQSASRCGFDLADTMLSPEDDDWRRLIAQRAVYSLFGGFSTMEHFAKHLQSRLIKRIDAEHHLCGISDSQREKLQLAGNGDIQGMVRQVERMCDQFLQCYEPGDEKVELPDDFVGDVWKLKQIEQRGVFFPGTKYSRMHERILNASQKQKLQVVASVRGSGGIVRIDSDRGVGVFEIRLTSCPLNETVLSNLAFFPELETLSLESTTVSNEDLPYLKSLPNLVTLDLDKTGISDEGMKLIATLTNLERLELSKTRVTDAGIEPLLSLKNLKWIDLSETAVTDAGVTKLLATFPEITISR